VAARIWILSSFGRYLPGKLWAIAGMAVMTERAGASGKVATAAAIVMQLLAIGTGVGAAAIAAGPLIEAAQPGAGAAMTILGLVAVGALAMVGSAATLQLMWRVLRREGQPPPPPRRLAVLGGFGFNVVAWLLYGVALAALARGILPDAGLGLRVATGVFAASYLGGFITPFAPGGLGGPRPGGCIPARLHRQRGRSGLAVPGLARNPS
jgi:hypothetical protein